MHYQIATVGPRLNEVPRDWEKLICSMEGSLYRKPRFHEFAEKQPKCSLYRWLVDSCCFVLFLFFCFVVVVFVLFVMRRRATQHLGIGTIPLNDICVLMST